MTREQKIDYIINLLQDDSMIIKLIKYRASMIVPLLEDVKLDEIITVLDN